MGFFDPIYQARSAF